jgi:preprotein translocase subunit Sss1
MSVNKENNNQENKFLSERKIADILTVHLERLGYVVVKELVLNNSLFDIRAITKRDISKVRIDVAAYKDGKITFIEVENGLWVTHPLLYRDFAHRVFLACPFDNDTPTDSEQISMAKVYGIGIIRISNLGSIIPVLSPIDYDIPPIITNPIISIIKSKLDEET